MLIDAGASFWLRTVHEEHAGGAAHPMRVADATCVPQAFPRPAKRGEGAERAQRVRRVRGFVQHGESLDADAGAATWMPIPAEYLRHLRSAVGGHR
jgi:hypothetical protein